MQETSSQIRQIDLQPSTAQGLESGSETAAGSVFFIGNATVLIRFRGFTILTDPTFIHVHEEVSIGYGMHLGGTMVMGILVTMDAEQGVEALQIVQPQMAIPIHYNDYDVFKSPLSEFQLAVAEAGLAGKVHYLSHGDTYSFTIEE